MDGPLKQKYDLFLKENVTIVVTGYSINYSLQLFEAALNNGISFEEYQQKIRDIMQKNSIKMNLQSDPSKIKYIKDNVQFDYIFCGLDYDHRKHNKKCNFDYIKKIYSNKNVKITIVVLKCPFCFTNNKTSTRKPDSSKNNVTETGLNDFLSTKNLILNCFVENKTRDSAIIILIDHFDLHIDTSKLEEYYRNEIINPINKSLIKKNSTSEIIVNRTGTIPKTDTYTNYQCEWLKNPTKYQGLFQGDIMNFDTSDKSPYFCENMENLLGPYANRQTKFKTLHVSFQTGKNVDFLVDQISKITNRKDNNF